MNERNCGFCRPCARGDYDKCETRAAELPPTVVFVLFSFDRWAKEYENPWHIIGFKYDEEEVKQWVKDSEHFRRYEKVEQKK